MQDTRISVSHGSPSQCKLLLCVCFEMAALVCPFLSNHYHVYLIDSCRCVWSLHLDIIQWVISFPVITLPMKERELNMLWALIPQISAKCNCKSEVFSRTLSHACCHVFHRSGTSVMAFRASFTKQRDSSWLSLSL